MNKTEKYNIQSIDIHGHGCDVTELKHVLPPEEFAIETASLSFISSRGMCQKYC